MPSRLWLDATDPDGTRVLHKDSAVPRPSLIPPTIPPRYSAGLEYQNQKILSLEKHSSARRNRKAVIRHSRISYAAPPKTTTTTTTTTTTVKSATNSPELISDLIDSLVHISSPERIEPDVSPLYHSNATLLGEDSQSFDALKRKHRNSRVYNPNFEEDSDPTGAVGEVGVSKNDHQTEFDEISAADFPVVRTGKNRDSYHQKRSSRWDNALGISSGGRKSNPSLTSQPSQDDNLLNPTHKKRANLTHTGDYSFKNKNSTKRDTSESTTSSKREGKKHVKSSPSLTHSPLLEGPSVPDRRSSRLFINLTPKTHRSTSNSPNLAAFNANANASSSSSKNEWGNDRELHRDVGREPVEEPNEQQLKINIKNYTFKTTFDSEPKTLINLDLSDDEDSQVAKRIKELKARKELRDREASLSPQVSLDTNGLPTTVSTVINTSDSDPKPARKPKAPPAQLKLASSTHTALNERLPTPFTPTTLPINYSFVLQSLQNRPGSSKSSLQLELPLQPPSQSQPKIHSPLRAHPVLPPPPLPPAQTQSQPLLGAPHRPAMSQVKSSLSRSLFGGGKKDSASSPSPAQKRDIKVLHSTEPDIAVGNKRRSRQNSLTQKKRWSLSEVPKIGAAVERHSSLRGAPNRFMFGGSKLNEPDDLQEEIDHAVDQFLASKRFTQRIKHPDTGRVISFSEVGNRKGNVVFCCVGMGITRFATAFYDELAVTLNLRIITPDRPGVGESAPNPLGTPLSWADDILVICSTLRISKFSLLAHSAGAIYALATALRVPQHIRGKVHLLAPWIPPSQMEPVGMHQVSPPSAQLPRSQRFLRALPATFLKVANSNFLTATSASLSPNLGSAGQRRRRKIEAQQRLSSDTSRKLHARMPIQSQRPESIMLMDQQSFPSESTLNLARSPNVEGVPSSPAVAHALSNNTLQVMGGLPHQRSVSAPMMSPMTCSFRPTPSLASPMARKLYDETLTAAIWDAATANANPLVDLLVCLERTQNIGFRYVEINRSVVIHHGAKDNRVPVENIKWLGNSMRRCEVRVFEDEGHGLMASALVMGSVLTEMAKEWEDWAGMVSKGRVGL